MSATRTYAIAATGNLIHRAAEGLNRADCGKNAPRRGWFIQTQVIMAEIEINVGQSRPRGRQRQWCLSCWPDARDRTFVEG